MSASGHATVSITLDTYSHAIPAMQEEAAELIAGLVFAEKAIVGVPGFHCEPKGNTRR